MTRNRWVIAQSRLKEQAEREARLREAAARRDRAREKPPKHAESKSAEQTSKEGTPTPPPPLSLSLSKKSSRLTGLRRLRRPSLVAFTAGIALLGGAVWLTSELLDDSGSTPKSKSAQSDQAGKKYPYGSAVGLEAPLYAGDCVDLTWSGKAYKSLPLITSTSSGCRESFTEEREGQVIATVPGREAAAARNECEARTGELRDTLADPVLYTLLPGAGSTHTKAACLVFQRGVDLGGPLGKYRKTGDVYETQLGTGDCVDTDTNPDSEIQLRSCAEPHDEQVIATIRLDEASRYEDLAPDLICERKYQDSWLPNKRYKVSGWVSEWIWEEGFHYGLCVIRDKEDRKLPAGTIKPVY